MPDRTYDEQTRCSWARLIQSFADLPEIYHDLFPVGPDGARVLPHAVLTPTYEGFLRRENQKLVYTGDRRIHIAERVKTGLARLCFPLDGISYVERGEILLHAWLKIRGLDDAGILRDTTLNFNSTSAYLFAPIIQAIRPAADASSPGASDPELAKFDVWVRENYKFMSYARRSILPGERVLQAILQPEIREDLVSLFGASLGRTVSPTHITILTDKELIVVKETVASRWTRDDKYGGVWTFLPLAKVVDVSLMQKAGGTVLSIRLPGDDQIELRLSPANLPQYRQLCARLGKSLHTAAPFR